ncbi:MAG TPA: hypothetical protein VGU20_30395 [Stellaceae bacterium]|nr:hypothetical protein [Stellaceae bacterium]
MPATIAIAKQIGQRGGENERAVMHELSHRLAGESLTAGED